MSFKINLVIRQLPQMDVMNTVDLIDFLKDGNNFLLFDFRRGKLHQDTNTFFQYFEGMYKNINAYQHCDHRINPVNIKYPDKYSASDNCK